MTLRKRQPDRRQERALRDAEQAMLERWANVPKFSRTSVRSKARPVVPGLSTPVGRPTGHDIPSRSTPGGTATRPVESLRYTGSAMLGLGTLHKSNAVPIFSPDEAVQIARMRRG